MKDLNRTNFNAKERPIRVLQFGEGNFLRAFVDWILQDLNDKGIVNADVAVVQPTPHGRVRELQKQDGLYTVCLEGIDGGEKVQSRRVIDVLREFVDPYTDYDKYLELAKNEFDNNIALMEGLSEENMYSSRQLRHRSFRMP